MDWEMFWQTWLREQEQGSGSRQQRLYRYVREAIQQGRLPAGVKLPASREVAAQVGMARNTVMNAYAQLQAEGYVLADRQGTRVMSGVPSVQGIAATLGALPALAQRAGHFQHPPALLLSDTVPFAPGPDLHAFPLRQWRGHLEAVWREVRPAHLGHAPLGGMPALRQAVADYLRVARGVRCDAGQVMITAGSHSALEVCARVLADPGDTVWLENPGYPGMQQVFRQAGLQLVGVPVDEEGIALKPMIRRGLPPPRLLCVTPAHQYPTGTVMSVARRHALIQWVREQGCWLIEDDFDAEFCHDGQPLAALQGLVADAVGVSPVIHVGTFSKILWPGLRLGYLVVPPSVSAVFARAVMQQVRPGQGIEQEVLARLIASGDFAQHLRKMRKVYAARQQALVAELRQQLPAQVTVQGGRAGIHLVLRFPSAWRDEAVVAPARTLGLVVRPLSQYALPDHELPCGRGELSNGLLLGYGALDIAQIPSAVARLTQVIRGCYGVSA